MIITGVSIEEFSRLVAGTDFPVPAAGSVAAVDGLLGVSLLELCLQVSNNSSEGGNLRSEEETAFLQEMKKVFKVKMEEDINVFKINREKDFSDRKLCRKIVTVPLEIVTAASRVLLRMGEYEKEIKGTVAADFVAARENLSSTFEIGLSIVEHNLEMFTYKDEFVKELLLAIDTLWMKYKG